MNIKYSKSVTKKTTSNRKHMNRVQNTGINAQKYKALKYLEGQ